MCFPRSFRALSVGSESGKGSESLYAFDETTSKNLARYSLYASGRLEYASKMSSMDIPRYFVKSSFL